jgi:uncharacterized protein YodC (DUF2158 family)
MSKKNDSKFEIGDVVKLNAGGPEMSVYDIPNSSEYVCQWFAGKKLEDGCFHGKSLILVNNQGADSES